ncbi:hypothetical protein B0H14DRAFT_3156985 [Mycena olivaceomarginata]|nr:hypothetical protein B0H14DRAFT_3156985 [Mycena olivaceomarginata]
MWVVGVPSNRLSESYPGDQTEVYVIEDEYDPDVCQSEGREYWKSKKKRKRTAVTNTICTQRTLGSALFASLSDSLLEGTPTTHIDSPPLATPYLHSRCFFVAVWYRWVGVSDLLLCTSLMVTILTVIRAAVLTMPAHSSSGHNGQVDAVILGTI